MKSKTVAFVLSMLIAGAGLAYLKLWKQAAINFGLALGVGVTLFLLPEQMFNLLDTPVAGAVAGVSGAYAMEMAEKLNKEASATPTMEELSEQTRLP